MEKRILTVIVLWLCAQPALFAATGIGESASGFLTSLPPEAPELTVPADGAEVPRDTLALSWRSRIHTASYTLQVSEEADFGALFTEETLTDTTFLLPGLSAGTAYHWRVRGSNAAGDGDFSGARSFSTAVSSVSRDPVSVPERFALLPAYPNPFNPGTTIAYDLPEDAEVSLVIHNSTGQFVRELAAGPRQAGRYTVRWDGRDHGGAAVTSGMYLCILRTENRVMSRKLLLMR